ncbi:MAG TPA: O-antigen ligase family protein [Cyclobacteriaceae bacterium]|nr:O-antigen ligase family protein [Cyclobacteriaceae bacterium]
MLRKSLQVLFYVVALELTLGGGGRLTAIGPISLRMVLFAAAIIATAIHLFKFKAQLPAFLASLLWIYTGMMVLGISIGLINNAPISYLWEDVKPLLYFFLLPFIYFSVSDSNALSTIFKCGAVAMAAAFVFILTLIHTGIIPFLSFYHTVLDTGEFFFRGEITFFYKGFLYMCIGLIFLLENNGKKWQIILVLLAIILTVTRGFWMALLISYGSYYIIFSNKKVRGAVLIVAAVLLLLYSQDLIGKVSKSLDRAPEPKPYLLGDRTHSDNDRVRTVKEVIEAADATSAFIGHGFGIGVPIRPVHMEISYLEIFHKQGFIGLIVWFLIFINGYRKFVDVKNNTLAVPFFISSAFVFIQSLSNQFINNPIGLFMIMMALTVFEKKIPRNDDAIFSSQHL